MGARGRARGVRNLRCGTLKLLWGDEASLDSLGSWQIDIESRVVALSASISTALTITPKPWW